MWWVDLGRLPDTHPAALSLPFLNKVWGENKIEKKPLWVTLKIAEAACASEGRRGIHLLLPIIRQMFSPFPGSRPWAGVTDAWKDKCRYVQTTLLPSPFNELLLRDILWYGIYTWVSCPGYVPSQTLVQEEGERKPWRFTSPLQQ